MPFVSPFIDLLSVKSLDISPLSLITHSLYCEILQVSHSHLPRFFLSKAPLKPAQKKAAERFHFDVLPRCGMLRLIVVLGDPTLLSPPETGSFSPSQARSATV